MLKPIKITIKLLILIGSFIFLYFVIQYGQFNLPSPPPSCPSSLDGLTVIFADCGQGVDYYGVLSSLMMLSIPLLFIGGVVVLSDIRNKTIRAISKWSVMLATSAAALRLLQILYIMLQKHLLPLKYFLHPVSNVYSSTIIIVLLITISNILILIYKIKFVKILYITLFIILNITAVVLGNQWFRDVIRFSDYPLFEYVIAIFVTSILGLLFVLGRGAQKWRLFK